MKREKTRIQYGVNVFFLLAVKADTTMTMTAADDDRKHIVLVKC